MSEYVRTYLGLGSNLGDRLGFLRGAIGDLQRHPYIQLAAIASVYETEPVGYTAQGKFLNTVAAVDTTLAAEALLDVTQAIEKKWQRERTVRWGPRTLDIDILLYGTGTVQTERLTVPHPRMKERGFALLPLAELAPELVLPGTAESVSEHVQNVGGKEGVTLCATLSLAAEFGLSVG